MKNSIIQVAGLLSLAVVAYLYQKKLRSIKKTIVLTAILFLVCFSIYYWVLPRLLV
jgi:hypothetical protein